MDPSSVEPTLTAESVRTVADAIGLAGSLAADGGDAAKELAEQATFRVRSLLQDALKYMMHAKRRRMNQDDLDMALRVQGQEPLYGVAASQHIPFRFASGGGRDLHFIEEKEIDLSEMVSGALPKIPLGVSLRAHWLAIDGVQPSIPENPPAANKEQLLNDAANPLCKLNKHDPVANKLQSLLQSHNQKMAAARLKTTETVNVKQLAKHELSVEQQLYYKEITEACVGSDESRRTEALQSLACDPGLHQMLPRLCTFIAEGVRVNVVQHNLAILIYLMRMVKSLLENQTLFLEKYLHELIPAVSTCIVARQLCARPESDNHWALRDFASRLMANICKNFNTSTNNIQTRVTRMFADALRSEKTPLVSCYGAIAGLQELGPEVIKVFILPHLKYISARTEWAQSETVDKAAPLPIDRAAANNIRVLVTKGCAPVLKSIRPPPDVPEDYKTEFGSVGIALCAAAAKIRAGSAKVAAAQPAPAAATAAATATTAATAGPTTVVRSVSTVQVQQQQQQVQVAARPTLPTPTAAFLVQQGPASAARLVQGGTPSTPSTPGTPGAGSIYFHPQQLQQPPQ